MIAPNRRFHERPAILGKAYGWCADHGYAYRKDTANPACPKCGEAEREVATVAKRPKAGSDTESLLAAQLAAAGYFDATEDDPDDRFMAFRRAVPWGLALVPERGFTADFGFIPQRLLVEVKGLAHAAGRKKVRADVEREGLAVGLGWTVLPISPEDVRNGEAVALIRRALQARDGREG